MDLYILLSATIYVLLNATIQNWTTTKRFVIQLWRANMEIQPVIFITNVLYHLTKYAAKSEQSFKPYEEWLRYLLHPEVVTTDTVKEVICKFMTKSIVEKDYSPQEVFYLLIGPPVYPSSRKFISVMERHSEEVHLRRNEEQAQSESMMKKYRVRPLHPSFIDNKAAVTLCVLALFKLSAISVVILKGES